MPTDQHVLSAIYAVHTSLSTKLEELEQKMAELDEKLDECMSDAETEYTLQSEEEEEEEDDPRLVVITFGGYTSE